MIQCVSDSNPYDDEPDPIQEAEAWLKQHPEGDRIYVEIKLCNEAHARDVIQGLLDYIEENV